MERRLDSKLVGYYVIIRSHKIIIIYTMYSIKIFESNFCRATY